MSDTFEERIQKLAQHLPYPPTPAHHIARRHQLRGQQWLGRAAALVIIIGLLGLASPTLRASMLEFFQLGAVTIYLDTPAESGEALRLGDVSGETTLAELQQDTTVYAFPDDPPDRIFRQEDDLIISVWLDGEDITRALYQTDEDHYFIAKQAGNFENTDVRGNPAFWLDSRHPVFFMHDGEIVEELTHFVSGNVLVWMTDGYSFRLETGVSLDEARRLAASLQALNR